MSDILDSDNSGLSEDNDRIIQTDLRNEMSRSYLEYAMSETSRFLGQSE